MDTKVYSNGKGRKMRVSFHVEQTANRLWTVPLRRFGGDRLPLGPQQEAITRCGWYNERI